MINKKAAELYILAKKSNDVISTLLEALVILKDTSIDEVLKTYLDIKAGKTTVAEVISASELSGTAKEQLEKNVTAELKKKPIFLYSIDKELLGGYIVKINDNILDKSLVKKIRTMEVKS